jgi:NADH-quinone oxidoreductase subunit J
LEAVIFYGLAGIVLAAGVVVVAHPNPLKGAMALVGAFFALAGLYAMLHAHLLAALQLLVYAGGIMVLFIFIIMLLDLKDEDFRRITRGRVTTTLGAAAALAVAAALVGPILAAMRAPRPAAAPPVPPDYGSIETVAMALFRDYVFVFEATSLLLLVAIVGAVVMARRGGDVRPAAEADAPDVEVAP